MRRDFHLQLIQFPLPISCHRNNLKIFWNDFYIMIIDWILINFEDEKCKEKSLEVWNYLFHLATLYCQDLYLITCRVQILSFIYFSSLDGSMKKISEIDPGHFRCWYHWNHRNELATLYFWISNTTWHHCPRPGAVPLSVSSPTEVSRQTCVLLEQICEHRPHLASEPVLIITLLFVCPF